MSGITLSYFFEKQINIFFRKALKNRAFGAGDMLWRNSAL